MRKWAFFLIGIFFMPLMGCTDTNNPGLPSTVGEVAFDSGYSSEHIVYVQENDEFIPYVVVTQNYQGLTLLLRKNVLDKTCVFNPENIEVNSSYYPDSEIRLWLEDTFQYMVKAPIEKVKLEVTSREGLNHEAGGTEKIESAVFLLSATEVCFPNRIAFASEGDKLDMFKQMDESRVAFTEDGLAAGWWLRTPNISKGACVYSVSEEGYVGTVGIYTLNGPVALGVRPAFCIKSDTKIVNRDGLLYLSD